MHFRDAKHMYETFSHHKADGCFALRQKWPYPQSVFGRALRTNYASDKFDGKWVEYTHAHGQEGLEGSDRATYPVILAQESPGEKKWGRPFFPPSSGELSWLGYVLEIEYFVESVYETPRYLDFKQMGASLPHLLGDPHRNILVISPQTGGGSFLLWSPILRITRRGIEQ